MCIFQSLFEFIMKKKYLALIISFKTVILNYLKFQVMKWNSALNLMSFEIKKNFFK